MNKNQEEIFRILDEIYPKEITFLSADTPFHFLITVILSASSTDKRAEESANALFKVYRDEKDLMNADVNEIEKLIHSSGLSNSKSKNIKELSTIICQKGSIPDTLETLIELPGVGVKTANCYLAHIKGEPAVIADIHFVRVAKRLGFTTTDDRIKAYNQIRENVPKKYWTRLSMVVNKHGREVCRPKPKCDICQIKNLCPFLKDAQK